MEYSFEFSQRLIESAEALLTSSSDRDEAGRAILYLSCVSCEISMKALLERSGYTTSELRGFSHRLHALLSEISQCGHTQSNQRASSIRSQTVVPDTTNGTVGTLLTSEIEGASTYPNQIRYGEGVRHFSPEAMLNCAKVVSRWCIENDGCLVRAFGS
jgi:hypothetical protein